MSDIKLAEQFMRRDLITFSPGSDVLSGVAMLMSENISGASVVDSDRKYLGVFSEKSCLNALTDLVEVASEEGVFTPPVRSFMKTNLITLTTDWKVFDAIDHILSKRISGAPVVNESGEFVGIFSEKTAMHVLIAAIHDSVPGTKIEAYMNIDQNRVIGKDETLINVAHKFQQTPYRRLPVLEGRKLVGQVSRRDVLGAEHRVASEAAEKATKKDASENLRLAARLQNAEAYMDRLAPTIGPKTDMLAIAQLFLNSPNRRLPVIDSNGVLVGQVSRRDLLETASALLKPTRSRPQAETLYLSQVASDRPSALG